MSDSDNFEEATNIVPTMHAQPKPRPTGTPAWLWAVLALVAAAVIAGAGFIGATIEGNAKDKTISAVENSLAREQSTATQAKNLADALQTELETEQQHAADNEATADARSTIIVDSNATADAAAEARATQEAIAADELAARETADAGSTSIAHTAQADSDARATAEAQATDSAGTAVAEIEARATADALAGESAATAQAEAEARATQEQVAAEAQSAFAMAETQIANAQATESALRSNLADVEATSRSAATEVADANNALATQESRAIENAGTASAAQIEINRLQTTIDAVAVVPPSAEPDNNLGPPDSDTTTQVVVADENRYSIRLPRSWIYQEEHASDALSDFYFGQTDAEMRSMRSDDTVDGVGGALFFFDAGSSAPTQSTIESSLEFSVNFYIDSGATTLNDPYVYTLADGRLMGTQTVEFNSQNLYIYVLGVNRMIAVGLLTEPTDADGTWHAQLEQIMISIYSPPFNGVSTGIDRSFDLNAERRNLPQPFTTSDGRLTVHVPRGWEFDDTFSTEDFAGFSGDLSFGSVFVIEEEPNTFPANSPIAGMGLMTFWINRVVIENGGHLLAEPGVFERDDGVIAVYCLAEDNLGLVRWTAVYIFENDNIVVAQVNYIDVSTFPEVRDQSLAIILSIEYTSQSRSSGPTG